MENETKEEAAPSNLSGGGTDGEPLKSELFEEEGHADLSEEERAVPEGESQAEPPQKGQKFRERAPEILKKFAHRYFIVAFAGMANGLFCTLIAGTILCQLARIFGDGTSNAAFWNFCFRFFNGIGTFAKVMMGAGIGVGIAHALKCPKMTLACSVAVGIFAANAPTLISYISQGDVSKLSSSVLIGTGNPITCYLAVVVSSEIGTLVTGKTKLDILIVPLVSMTVGGLIAGLLGTPVEWLMGKIGQGINAAAEMQPFLMGLLISVAMGLLLTLPTSSAAIGISIGLNGIAAGAGVAGCCAHMIGFAVASFRENKFPGLIAQGLGTSMLQIPNLKNPRILLPAVLSSAIVGPLSTCLFQLRATAVGSGMGTAGLVGVIDMIGASAGVIPVWQLVLGVILVCFVLPAAISFGVSELLRKLGWIKKGDMKIET